MGQHPDLVRLGRSLLMEKGELDWVFIDSPHGFFAVEPRPDPKNGVIMELTIDPDGSGEFAWKEAGVGYPLEQYDLLMKKIFLTGSL